MRWYSIAIVATLVAACDSTPTEAPIPAPQASNGISISATGGGHYLLSGVADTKFSFSAVQKADGTAMGQFRMALEDSGFTYDFHAEVTCLAVDVVETGDGIERRAWIGGVIKRNDTTDPGFQGGVFTPGHDIWFRVLDRDEGDDLTTFVGFETVAIPSSAAYCAGKPWRVNNMHLITNGHITVRS